MQASQSLARRNDRDLLAPHDSSDSLSSTLPPSVLAAAEVLTTSSDSLSRPISALKEKDIIPLKAPTPTLDEIRQKMRTRTAGEYVHAILNEGAGISDKDKPLYIEDFSEEYTEKLFETFARVGMKEKNWDAWFDLFAEDAFYISDDKHIHLGRETIRTDIGTQIRMVDTMDYEFIDLKIYKNSVTVASNNIMRSKDGCVSTFVNISTFWFNKEGKAIAAIDTIDKGVATERTLAWVARDTVEGGPAGSNFFTGLVNMVKNMCGCTKKPKSN